MSEETAGPAQAHEKRSRAATRQKLIESAPAVFARQGIDGASINDLCAAAGFSRGAFYSNFETKAELAIAVFGHLARLLTETLDAQLDRWLASELDAETMVARIVEGVTDRVSNAEEQAVRAELFLAAFRHPELRNDVEPTLELIYGAIERALKRVAESRHLIFVIPPEDVSRLLVTSYSGLLMAQMAMGESARGTQVIPAIWLSFTRPA